MKKLFLITFLFLICVAFVLGITLTSNATSRVVVPVAVRAEACLWDIINNSCINSNQDIVFGIAKVYDVTNRSVDMVLFIVNGSVYRGITGNFEYKNDNLIRLNGILSHVLDDGTEEDSNEHNLETASLSYDILFNDGLIPPAEYDRLYSLADLLTVDSYKNLLLKIGGQYYKMQNVVTSSNNLVWAPQ